VNPTVFHVLHSVGLAVGVAAAAVVFISVWGVIIRWWRCGDADERRGWFRFGVMIVLMGLVAIGIAAASRSMEDTCSVEQRWSGP